MSDAGQPKKKSRDSSPKRHLLCPLCGVSSAEYNFHRPNQAELRKLRGWNVLSEKSVQQRALRSGICERHWHIDLGDAKRPHRFRKTRPAIRTEGRSLLPTLTSTRRSSLLNSPPEDLVAEESREGPAVLRQSRRQLHESVLREQQLAREREQELQVLRARVLVLENRLSSVTSWSAQSLQERNQLPLLTGTLP